MTGADGGGPADRAGTEADMGAQRSAGSLHGRRSARPDAGDDARDAPGATRAAVLLAAALRGDRVGGEGERRAVDAFRDARDAGAHQAARTARVRRRDDWRPRERRRARRSLRTTLSVVLASLTLGGVAYAAIGAGDTGGPPATGTPPAGDRGPAPIAPTGTGGDGGPAGPGPSAVPSAVPSGATAAPGGPAADRDSAARCRAPDAGDRQRPVAVAGGEQHVAEDCARRHARRTEPSTADDGSTGPAGNTGSAGGRPGGPAGASGDLGTDTGPGGGSGTDGGNGDGNGDGNGNGNGDESGNAGNGKKADQGRGKGG